METAQTLQMVPIFFDLTDEELETLSEITYRKSFKKNEVILVESEIGSSLYIIESGKVKITRIADDGREVVLSILTEGEFFGEMAILDGQNRSATVVALTDSELLCLKREDFQSILVKYPQITISLLREMANRLRKSDQQIEALSLGNATEKVARTVLRLAEEIGIYRKGAVVLENMPLQQDLANMSGTARETISRVLKIFRKQGLIEKDGNSITILDYERFKETFSK